MIPFNKPYLTGKELNYIEEAVKSWKLSGNGVFTNKCHDFFKEKFGFNKCLLTTSCTDALEMAAILCGIEPGDEVIMPSYTFVSTANAFILRGAKIVFTDSRSDHPGMDEDSIESLITSKTKAIVPVHYAGVACDMDKVMSIAEKNKLFVIEDAAQAIDSYYKGKPLGSFGHFSCFSFHETKNIQCGEGGMLVVNDERFFKRAEIIWEKGTNRAEFYRGEANKYGWVDIGSSFLPSEITAAFLYAQLESMRVIQKIRKVIWEKYYDNLKGVENMGYFKLPVIPDYATNNGHMFYLVMNSGKERDHFINQMKLNSFQTVFHYLPLHQSIFYCNKHDGRELPNSEYYSESLVRLPLYNELSSIQNDVIKCILSLFYK
jgi:dTDP-4-amino-4,6-dideoxygalactose transaminase